MPTHVQNQDIEQQERDVGLRMARIKQPVIVLSGKGGVGKSTVSVNLAAELARLGFRVGLLDVDIHGPSVPGMLGLNSARPFSHENAIVPVEYATNFHVMSIGFLLQQQDDAVIWRGPMKYQVIRQFLGEVEWGNLDFLIIDSPPGTGDEPLSVAQFLGPAKKALVVTTPQRVSIDDVRKSVQFCEKLEMPLLGIIENMSGFVCPHCGKTTDIFKSGGGNTLAEEKNIPLLGQIPIEPSVVETCDDGKPVVLVEQDSITKQVFAAIAEKVTEACDMKDFAQPNKPAE